MFSRSKNDPDETRPNINISPIDLGHPGTLPVINKEAVKHVIRVGVAVGGNIADYTEFDRKNYFYPDIPKGYQISQYKYPLVSGGKINGVELTRIHLEEDTGTSQHDKGEYSIVNFNRAGIPLMELVTEPVISSATEAVAFARELQLLLQYLEVSNANMEKGEMRLEANISVSKDPNKLGLNRPEESVGRTDLQSKSVLGTKVEVKNLNSFRSLEKSIEFEIDRQINMLESGKKVEQETRGWHDEKQVTFSQRKKEGSADYRYFPDPDLPKLKISEIAEFDDKKIKKELPELPWEKRTRYKKFNLENTQEEIFVSNRLLGGLFDDVSGKLGDKDKIKIAANYITSDLVGLSGGNNLGRLQYQMLADLVCMIDRDDLSSRGAKDLLKILFEEGGDAEKIAENRNLTQKSNEEELVKVVEKIIRDNKQAVEEYKAGKEASVQFLVGQGMKETKGSANPQILKKLFENLLTDTKD